MQVVPFLPCISTTNSQKREKIWFWSKQGDYQLTRQNKDSLSSFYCLSRQNNKSDFVIHLDYMAGMSLKKYNWTLQDTILSYWVFPEGTEMNCTCKEHKHYSLEKASGPEDPLLFTLHSTAADILDACAKQNQALKEIPHCQKPDREREGKGRGNVISFPPQASTH